MLVVSTGLSRGLRAGAESERPWLEPVVLGACSAPATPQVLFPDDNPKHATGPGAIVWSAARGCPDGAGARVSAIVAGGDVPTPSAIPKTAANAKLALTGLVAAMAAPHGQILLAGPYGAGTGVAPGAGAVTPGALALSEGPAHGPFTPPQVIGDSGGPSGGPGGGPGTPVALTTAYLGDVAIASSDGPYGSHGGHGGASASASAIQLRIHRYYARGLQTAPLTIVTPARGPIEGLTLALDYRSDALVVWEQAGAIYARELPGQDRSGQPTQRVASAAPHARIAALLSDDDRGILAWTSTEGGVTSVYAELSAPGVRFGAPRLLERFADLRGPAPANGSPQLVRLLSESVMLAWSGAQNGDWVVRSAAIDLRGVRGVATISPPGHDALLADLAPGPDGEAIALWSEPRATPSGPDFDEQALVAARGIDAYPGRTIFAAPELIVPAGTITAAGPAGAATVGIDPDSDRAIVAWRAADGAVVFSLHALDAR